MIEALATLTFCALVAAFVLVAVVVLGPPIWLACSMVWTHHRLMRKSPEEKP